MIPFNKPANLGTEISFIKDAVSRGKLSGDGYYSRKCQNWFESHLGVAKTLLTSSCTHALEIAAILLNLCPGDEVIMPSYTFVSTANAFVLRGARIVFVDIDPITMNIDPTKIEAAISSKSKAIVPVHYGGVPCDMDKIMDVANKHNLIVIEDAAQAIGANYKDKPLGSIGHIGCISFHETKNITSGGEGGLLVLNDQVFISRAEIIREKGTNRSAFFRQEVDRYSWKDIGSSYLASELQAAYLWGQIRELDKILESRIRIWNKYFERLASLENIEGLQIPSNSLHQNGHIFYLKCLDIENREKLIKSLLSKNIMAVSHYVPLHSSNAGKQFGKFMGIDEYTSSESERLLRLPLWYGLPSQSIDYIADSVLEFYG